MSYGVTIVPVQIVYKRGEIIARGKKSSSIYTESSKKTFLRSLLFDLAFTLHEYILFYFPTFFRMLSS